MTKPILLRLLAVLFLLVSCSGISREDCISGDWRAIGQRDGQAGYGPERLSEQARICKAFGVSPDAAAWEKGRREGVRQYCTPQNAYQLGRKGRPISDLCTASDKARMASAHAQGLKYHEISVKILHLQQVIMMNRMDIREILGATNGGLTVDAMLAQSENFRLEEQIHQLERERQAYANWP
ncbi:MAG: DUF2799 domain-containing protein [Rhodobacteraceae bacterium]|nr:DUF2799 domain-containing protein [Paracoccaceae bacterium]